MSHPYRIRGTPVRTSSEGAALHNGGASHSCRPHCRGRASLLQSEGAHHLDKVQGRTSPPPPAPVGTYIAASHMPARSLRPAGLGAGRNAASVCCRLSHGIQHNKIRHTVVPQRPRRMDVSLPPYYRPASRSLRLRVGSNIDAATALPLHTLPERLRPEYRAPFRASEGCLRSARKAWPSGLSAAVCSACAATFAPPSSRDHVAIGHEVPRSQMTTRSTRTGRRLRSPFYRMGSP